MVYFKAYIKKTYKLKPYKEKLRSKSGALELIVGVEPTTSALRMLCSAIKLYQQIATLLTKPFNDDYILEIRKTMVILAELFSFFNKY